MEQLTQHLEALIFCSETALSLDEMAAALKLSYDWDLEDEILLNAIDQVRQKYINEDFAFELREINGGYQFFTKKMFHPTIGALIQHKSRKKLSVAQMEVLSIIAYKQPISKTEVEHIRGVNCDYPVQKLLEKNLVEIAGKSDGPGKPLMYATSENFMDYFGLKSVADLPQLKDIRPEQNEIGEITDQLDEAAAPLQPIMDTEQLNSESPVMLMDNPVTEPMATSVDEIAQAIQMDLAKDLDSEANQREQTSGEAADDEIQ
ncbi:MAG: hypothetical protein RIQ89_1830 [Bacteroidota bacterium]|jgi:segregation and condensation protein B